MGATTDGQTHPVGDIEKALSLIGTLDPDEGDHLIRTLVKAHDLRL
jgi:hypothetical protein